MLQLAMLYTRAVVDIKAPLVMIEADLSNGLPAFNLVGLPEAAVKESRERVRGALLNTQFEFPARRITLNLAPADLPKEGGRFDLGIAIAILAASGQIPSQSLSQYEFIGELALSGALRRVSGILPIAIACAKAKRMLILPVENAVEASLVPNLTVLPAENILSVCSHLLGKKTILPYTVSNSEEKNINYDVDMQDIIGQPLARRALEVAAAGGHHLLLKGSPGAGKTMLASRLSTILPALSTREALESAAIHSISALGFDEKKWRLRPFRSPHHSASAVALVGGGNPPKPGEISLAHHGVLFLDELPEFARHVLEMLREPLESGLIRISRAARQADFPARFQLIAAMNPCPCGYYGDQRRVCRCTPAEIKRYQSKISGPLLERIDLHVFVEPVHLSDLQRTKKYSVESSAVIRGRVIDARKKQWNRSKKLNADLSHEELKSGYCDEKALLLLQKAAEKWLLSARVYYRLLKVARTIADLAGEDVVSVQHVQEALSYRLISQGF